MTTVPIPATQRVLWAQIHVVGPDAQSFLQGQLSNDVHAARVTPALILEPTSDVVSSVLVEGVSEDWSLLLRREVAEAALARLRRFHLRSKSTLELTDADSGPYDLVGDQVALGHPGPSEFASKRTPHAFGSDFVRRYVSFTKGCFTGQELVGRLDARGAAAPFRFVRVRGAQPEAMEAALRDRGPQVGSGLTTVVEDADGFVALGFAHRTLFEGDSVVTVNDVRIELLGEADSRESARALRN